MQMTFCNNGTNQHKEVDRFYRADPSRNSQTGGYGICSKGYRNGA